MKFFTVRDLRTAPRSVWDTLEEQNEAVITNNGKPTALMLSIDENSFEDTLASVRQVRAMRAVNRMQMAASESGVSQLSLEEINAEIASTRKEHQLC